MTMTRRLWRFSSPSLVFFIWKWRRNAAIVRRCFGWTTDPRELMMTVGCGVIVSGFVFVFAVGSGVCVSCWVFGLLKIYFRLCFCFVRIQFVCYVNFLEKSIWIINLNDMRCKVINVLSENRINVTTFDRLDRVLRWKMEKEHEFIRFCDWNFNMWSFFRFSFH